MPLVTHIKESRDGQAYICTIDGVTGVSVPKSMVGGMLLDVRDAIKSGLTVLPADDTALTDIDDEAAKRAFALTPGGNRSLNALQAKQRNMTARAVELLDKRSLHLIAPLTNLNLTASEQAELDAIKALFTKIKAVRSHSDNLQNAHKAGEKVNIPTGTCPSYPGGWPA